MRAVIDARKQAESEMGTFIEALRLRAERKAMAEHQGLPVAGYRPQSDTNIQMVNLLKEQEERLLRILDEMATSSEIDQRLLEHGRIQLQGAFMFINRSVFKPGRVKLPEDGT